MLCDFLNNLESSLLSNIGVKTNNFSLIKHYNSFYFSKDDITTLNEKADTLTTFFHEFDASTIVGPYEPFLGFISEFCKNNPVDMDDLFESCNVYSLHRSILKSYIITGRSTREEDLLLDEIPSEQIKLVESLARIILYLSKVRPILFIANELQSAGPSTLSLLLKLMDRTDNKYIGVLATYNESQHALIHASSLWETFYNRMVAGNHLLESGTVISPSSFERITDFNFTSNEIDNYLTLINNLFTFLDLEQVTYYLEIIYKIINVEGVSIPKNRQLDFLQAYALSSIFTKDMSKALLLCDNILELSDYGGDYRTMYNYYYLLSLTHMYNGNLTLSAKLAANCYDIARTEHDNFFMYRANMLLLMTKMSGWHNIYFCNQNFLVEDSLIEQATAYRQFNHLAHIYIYAFDNDPDFFVDEITAQNKLFNFNKGIAYAKMLGNDYFLFEAYRNNIMIASTNGYYKTANFYYHICYSLIKGKDIFAEANIYNGLGYNSTAMEEFNKANEYYNKAMHIFQDLNHVDYLGETFYNMALNSIMANDYAGAYSCLKMAMKIVNSLHLNSLRVCNISKLYGLLALCSFKLKKSYSCNVYLNSARQLLSHLFNRPIAFDTALLHDHTISSDDLFVYYYATGLVSKDSKDYNGAIVSMKKAAEFLSLSLANQFYIYADYSIEYASVLCLVDKQEEAASILYSALSYYENKNCQQKVDFIKAAIENVSYSSPKYHFSIDAQFEKQILDTIKHIAIVKENSEQADRWEFLSTWQKLIEIKDRTKEQLVDTSIQAFMNSFNIDRLLFIQYSPGLPSVLFNNTQVSLSLEMHDALKEYFKKKRLGFVTSKINTNYNDYLDIITLFGNETICSIVGIPFYKNDELQGLLIAYILMKDVWRTPMTRYMLDESDFKIYDFVFRQFLTALDSLDANVKIQQMNDRLQHLSTTDHLTGLLNREGFYANILSIIQSEDVKKADVPFTIMYIDLDNFKYYNDTFGHNIGDLILVLMSRVFESVCLENGFVTRFGGDEFIITLNTTDPDVATEIARNIYEELRIQNYFTSEIEEVLGTTISIADTRKITCSIGISITEHVQSEEDFNIHLKEADSVLYALKKSTKGTFAFFE